jgi:DHA1 family bicyclomycin/chloramphenicol resistance-like MFS transporter
MSEKHQRGGAKGAVLSRHALVLGSLTALGAIGIDAYLPAFPVIAQALGTGVDRIQLSLVSYFVALAVGQLIYGPVSDAVGRKRPLLFGLAVFTLASVGAAFVTSVNALIALRFLQGLGACAGMVLALAAVRDLHSGVEAARLLALMILVLGVSPILAPLIGSTLVAFFPWTSIFWFMGGLGCLCFLMVGRFLEETHHAEHRQEAGIGPVLRNYAKLLTDRQFMGIVLVIGLTQAGLFAYVGGSPFVFLTLHGVSPTTYSLLFGMNALALIIPSQANATLIRRIGGPRLVRWSALLYALAGTLLLVATLTHQDSLPVTILFIVLCIAGISMIAPTGSLIALETKASVAGAASAMIGSLRFVFGALAGVLISVFFDGTARPMAAIISGSAVLAALLSRMVLPPVSATSVALSGESLPPTAAHLEGGHDPARM